MKSNVCKIEKGTRDLGAILKESERVAVYNELTHKQTLQLRLLCEEIDGMLPNIIDVFDGEFWIDFENHVCKVNVLLKIPEFNIYQKEELIGIAKNKKNSAAVGIVGKIRDSVENFLLDEMRMEALTVSSESFALENACVEAADYSYYWRLEEYKNFVDKDDQAVAWDELEKSVIASVADDIIVGVKGRQASITIVKKFA
jgi:hypothetical protein